MTKKLKFLLALVAVAVTPLVLTSCSEKSEPELPTEPPAKSEHPTEHPTKSELPTKSEHPTEHPK